MATSLRHRKAEHFQIHEDEPETAMTEDAELQSENFGRVPDKRVEENEDSEFSSSDESADDNAEASFQEDMTKLEDTFPGFRRRFRLIKRIGEGTFSTVYKAEDLRYHYYENSWDPEKENGKWTPPPLKRVASRGATSHSQARQQEKDQDSLRRPKYVAIKKIYVTSSPARILNELQLLHDLRDCPSVCPLITAFRHADQVAAILPYFRHADFRQFYRDMTVPDIAIYLQSLFTALAAIHSHQIIHRDIKPTNFLYDPAARRGVLVDFGLAEREGTESKPCLCHDDPANRRAKLRAHVAAAPAGAGPHTGYPKNDTRPSRRANRAGTRGFRAPEVLFKCTEQTVKIDVWSAGVILLTILSKRFPFFNSADDVEAMIEIAHIFGQKRMRAAGQLHGCMFETNIPTIGMAGFSLERIVLWSTCRSENGQGLDDDEKLAVQFLERCLDLDPRRRLSAEEALNHEFLGLADTQSRVDEDEEVDMLNV